MLLECRGTEGHTNWPHGMFIKRERFELFTTLHARDFRCLAGLAIMHVPKNLSES